MRHRLADRRSSRRIDDRLALGAFKIIDKCTMPLSPELLKSGNTDAATVAKNANESAEGVSNSVLCIVRARLGTQ